MFKKKKVQSELEKLNSALGADLVLSNELAAPAEASHIPFQRSETIEFLVVLVLFPSNVGIKNVEAVADVIVPLCRDYVMDSALWGMEIFVTRIPESGPRKVARIMIPRDCVSGFSFAQVPRENRNFGESEIGCIWYANDLNGSTTTECE